MSVKTWDNWRAQAFRTYPGTPSVAVAFLWFIKLSTCVTSYISRVSREVLETGESCSCVAGSCVGESKRTEKLLSSFASPASRVVAAKMILHWPFVVCFCVPVAPLQVGVGSTVEGSVVRLESRVTRSEKHPGSSSRVTAWDIFWWFYPPWRSQCSPWSNPVQFLWKQPGPHGGRHPTG